MTSSARPSSAGGIVRPSAFAVLSLITIANFSGLYHMLPLAELVPASDC
jgi:hypothetical protein